MNLVSVPHSGVGGAVLVEDGAVAVFAALLPTALVVEEVFVEEVLSLSVPESVLEGAGVETPIGVGVGAFAVRLVLVPHSGVGGAVFKFGGALAVPQPVLPAARVPRLAVPEKPAFAFQHELAGTDGFHGAFVAFALRLVDVERHHAFWNAHAPVSREQRGAILAVQGAFSMISPFPEAALILQNAAGPVAFSGAVVCAVLETAFVNGALVAAVEDALAVKDHRSVALQPDWSLIANLAPGVGVHGHPALGATRTPIACKMPMPGVLKQHALAVELALEERPCVMRPPVFPEERAFAVVLAFGKFPLVAHLAVVPTFLPGAVFLSVLEVSGVGDFAGGGVKHSLSVEAVVLELPDVAFFAVGVEVERGVVGDAGLGERDVFVEPRVLPVLLQVAFPNEDGAFAEFGFVLQRLGLGGFELQLLQPLFGISDTGFCVGLDAEAGDETPVGGCGVLLLGLGELGFHFGQLQLCDERVGLLDVGLGFRDFAVLCREEPERGRGFFLPGLCKRLADRFGGQFTDASGGGLHLRSLRIGGFVLLEELAVGPDRVLRLCRLKAQLADAVFRVGDLFGGLWSFLVGRDERLVGRNCVLALCLSEAQLADAGAGLGDERGGLRVRLVLGDVALVGRNGAVQLCFLEIRLDGRAADQERDEQGRRPQGESR